MRLSETTPRSTAQQLSRRFVLNALLLNPPENRSEQILRHLLSDRERVLHFLLLLLSDHDAGDFGKLFGVPGTGETTSAFLSGVFGASLFESLIRALDRDPERVEQVALIIEDLQRTPEGADLLPKDLASIWEPIWQVRQEQLAAGIQKRST